MLLQSSRMLSALTQTIIEAEPHVEQTHVTIQWRDVSACVEPFLASVRKELLTQTQDFIPELSEICCYALAGQGKLLRPAIFALSNHATGSLGKHSIQAATIVEMIHLASLIHDDVIDVAEIRRTKPTLAKRWDNRTAVLIGDCILSQAACLSFQLDNQPIALKILQSARNVCFGETLQSLHAERVLSKEDYFKIIGLKTGELFALASELGAILGGATTEISNQMRLYGMTLGTAYQLYDDCVDIFSSEHQSGKTLGIDLSAGKKTLPILLLLEKTAETEKTQVQHILTHWTPSRTEELLPFLRRHSVLALCYNVMEQYLEKATRLANSLAPSEAQQGLIRLPQFLLQQFNKLGN